MAKADPVRIAVTLGFAATSMVAVVGFWHAFSGARTPSAPAQGAAGPRIATVPVQVAARPIGRGETIDAAALRTISVAEGGQPGGYRTADAVAGLVARADILPGQIVLPGMVAADRGGAGLAALIPPGQRAVAIAVTEDMAVGNLIRPGDLVDVLLVLRAGVLPQAGGMPPVIPSAWTAATAHPASAQGDPSETRVLLQAVRVLTTGPRLDASLPGPGGAPPADGGATRTLTLCLTPSQAETVALARTLGTLALSLRNPADTRRAVLPPVTLPALRDGPAPAAATDPAYAGPRPVELIVGGDRRLIYPLAGASPGAAMPGAGAR